MFPVVCVMSPPSTFCQPVGLLTEVIGSYRPASTLVYWSQLLGVYVQLSALQVILAGSTRPHARHRQLGTPADPRTTRHSSVTIASTVVIVACVVMLFTPLRDIGRIVCYLYMLLNSIVLVVLLELGHRRLSTLLARSVAINSGVLSELSETARQVIKEVHGPSLTAGSERIRTPFDRDATPHADRRHTRGARTSLLMFCLSSALHDLRLSCATFGSSASYHGLIHHDRADLAAICQSQERASHPAMSIAATAVGLQATLAEDPEAAKPRLSTEGSESLKTRHRRRRRPRRPNGDGGAEAQARRRVEHEGAAGRAEAVDRPEDGGPAASPSQV